MLNRKVNLGVWRWSPSKTEAKVVFVIQVEMVPVGQTQISTKLEFITPCKVLLLAGSNDREAVAQPWLLSCSVFAHMWFSGPQPRLARVVSSGSVCTGTWTAGQCNLLRLQPEWAMRGWYTGSAWTAATARLSALESCHSLSTVRHAKVFPSPPLVL